MNDYISRKAALKAFENADADVMEDYGDGTSDWGFGRENIREILNSVPTADAVPVVRCRECIHHYIDEYGFPACAESGAMLNPEEDDYCSRGQRKNQSADVRNMDGGGADAP